MQRRTFLAGGLATVAAIATGGLALTRLRDDSPRRVYGDLTLRPRSPDPDAPDVLFISVDDCNDWVGFLADHPGTKTPNLDALAAESLVFTSAYTAAPLCLPARSAVMYGRTPPRTGVYDHSDASRQRYNDFKRGAPSLVDDFWAAGYEVVGAGKVFHGPETFRWDQYRQTESYAEGPSRSDAVNVPERFDPAWRSPYDGEPLDDRYSDRQIDFGPSDRRLEEEPDARSAAWIRAKLNEPRSGPVFTAFGTIIPHLPWRVPQTFFDLHPLADVAVPQVRADDLDDIAPSVVEANVDPLHQFEELWTTGHWAEAVQAYQAAISFADHVIGSVLDDLAGSPRAEDTIVALWSDHGYHLGEKMHIQKTTLWERATRVPLLVRAPGRIDPQTIEPPVSTLDLGPTLAALCDVEINGTHEGASLLPLISDPDLADQRPPTTTWLEGNHSVRRGPWRYIRYRSGATELYDHRVDPDEFDNIAERADSAAVISELDRFLPD